MLARRPPFPGMDPWVEQPAFWPGFHNRLVVAIADALAPLVGPDYFVAVEERLFFWSGEDADAIGIADVAAGSQPSLRWPARGRPEPRAVGPGVRVLKVRIPVLDPISEAYLEVQDIESRAVVAVIEVLSPTNKAHARGRRNYLRKRTKILGSTANLVEIDLLRIGEPMPLQPTPADDDYRILISRAPSRPRAELYVFSCRSPVPSVPVPLRPKEKEPALDLNDILGGLLDRGRFYLRSDYDRPPVPPLPPEDAEWARAIVAQAARA